MAAAVVISIIATVIIQGIHERNKYALFNAAEVGDLKQVKSLVQQGAPINQKLASSFGFTPLIGAIYHGCTDTAYYLIEAGADVNLPDNNGVTPLMWATSERDQGVPLVKFLIAHGARLDTKDKYGITVLGYAQAEPPVPQLVEVIKEAEQQNASHK